MNKFIFGLGAALLALVLTGEAKADGNHGHGGNRGGYNGGYHGGYNGGRAPVVTARPYYLDHGVRHNGGYIYRGRDHHQWSGRVWNTRYSRYQYYEPTLRCYYYWNPAQVAYYPCD